MLGFGGVKGVASGRGRALAIFTAAWIAALAWDDRF